MGFAYTGPTYAIAFSDYTRTTETSIDISVYDTSLGITRLRYSAEVSAYVGF